MWKCLIELMPDKIKVTPKGLLINGQIAIDKQTI